MDKTKQSVHTFINPADLIEQTYLGDQKGDTVKYGVEEADRFVRKQHRAKKKALMIVNLDKVTSTNLESHLAALKGMKEVPYDRISVYGPLHLQVLINTLAIVADKSDSVRAFGSRADALVWLRRK